MNDEPHPARTPVWEETAVVTVALRGCVMVLLSVVVYLGGFIALIAWGNSILILFLWLFIAGPIALVLMGLIVFVVMVPFALLVVLISRPFRRWSE